MFSLGCRGGGKSLLKVTAAVGSRCERDTLCILVQLGTDVCNWVEKGRLDLPSNENPCSGEERLPLFVVFPAY